MQVDAVTRARATELSRAHTTRRACRRPTAWLVAIAALSLMVWPGVAFSDGEASVAVEAGPGRYDVIRARELLVRADSATGQVWTVPLSGDGGWQALGSTPEAAGQPMEIDRYRVSLVGGGGRRGPQPKGPVQLLRFDHATGRAWLADLDRRGAWTPIAGAAGLSAPTSAAEQAGE